MKLIKSSLKYPQVTLTILVLVFVVGIYSLFNMPRREDPKITVRLGLVVAYFPGANSEQVEDQVTKKLEQYLFQYAEVRKEKTFSTSRDGAVVINVELEQWVKDPDVFWSKLRHELLVAKNIDLPKGVVGPIVNADFGDTIAMLIGVVSDSLDYSQLRVYLQKIEDDLRTVNAVSKIKRYGEQNEQISVTSNSSQLAQYGIKLSQVIQILQSQNVINATGDIKIEGVDVPLYTKGYYSSESQLRNQIIGATQTGEVVRLGDVADIRRTFAEPASTIDVAGHKALMLSVEMQDGNNIVKFGDEVTKKLAQIQQQLPSAIQLTTVVNQPKLVDESISRFIHEFLLAIVAVIIVTVLLLPIRVAAVAAMAIPVTIAATFALLALFNIELHQVSLAALIVVLGMVVDDAIVIADNYVELLDEGIDRLTAARRCASDLVVPVFTATATIVAAFLPMVILTGAVGEFIFALPVTVTIALASSFVIAMLLTPFLSNKFIKKGLQNHAFDQDNVKKGKRPSLLDRMQFGYNRSIAWCMKHTKTTIVFSIVTIAGAGILYFAVKQKFFPAAERNQFLVEIWMPSGTKLEKTTQAVQRIEAFLKKDTRVASYASFNGTSAPRFYYNFSPEPPVSNYAQILINTETDKQTEELSEELNEQVNSIVPEGRPHVRLMQQGSPTQAPVEVRIVGDETGQLKQLAAQVQSILQQTEGSTLIRNDYMEDYYGLSINLKDEANRLGYTTASVAGSIYTGFTGAPVSTIYEGNLPVNIVLRLNEENRTNFNDVRNTYLTSPITGNALPLRQIADLKPEWHSGRIIHRNGVRTITVQSETRDGALASEVLGKIQPQIARLLLPPGYRIEYGGEYENQKETFSQMIVALVVGIILIFLILLVQFGNLKESLVVMYSIPLSLFGAFLGLIATGNPFGFTAFIGLIALSGIVVRNAIILVDYTNQLINHHNMDIRTAAIEAGKRRLRPIFLTAMAAAIGVLPMILSGSPLWSPLASVIAFGVVFSMLMALLVIPVLFVAVVKPNDKKVAVTQNF